MTVKARGGGQLEQGIMGGNLKVKKKKIKAGSFCHGVFRLQGPLDTPM